MHEVLSGRLPMKTIKVNKNDLLAKLKVNLETHIKDYQEACRGYRAEAVRALDNRVNQLERGETVDVEFHDLEVPKSHEKVYRVVIGMMEMSIEDVIELSTQEFQSYVQDDWDWKADWSFSNQKYQSRG